MTYKNEKKYQAVMKFLRGMLTIVGLLFILHAVYSTIVGFKELATVNTAKQLLLTPFLTALVIPFIYLLAVWIHYETLFVHLGFRFANKILLRKIKRAIFRVAKLNINSVVAISQNLNKGEIYDTSNLEDYFATVIKEKSQ